MTLSNIILVLAALTAGLTAGLFFAWSCSVMPGLRRLSDREFVAVMQHVNRAIQNPVFFAAFFGAPVFLALAAYLHYHESPRFALLLAAFIVYLTGTFGVTVAGNVPMNNALDRLDLQTASEAEISRHRAGFERRWTLLNHIRAFASTLALLLAILACLN